MLFWLARSAFGQAHDTRPHSLPAPDPLHSPRSISQAETSILVGLCSAESEASFALFLAIKKLSWATIRRSSAGYMRNLFWVLVGTADCTAVRRLPSL